MNKNIILLITLLISGVAFSQVGIDTETPKTTLDIKASPDKPEKIDGILIPRLTGDELKAKDALYGADQVAAMVYVTAPVTGGSAPGSKTFYVNSEGFYYLIGDDPTYIWVKANIDARNGLSYTGDHIELGGSLIRNTVIRALTGTNKFSFRATNPQDAYINIGSGGTIGESGGVYLGNPSHGVTRGFPTIGADNNLGLYTTNGNLYLSTNGKQVGEFILADNGNVGIGLGSSNPTTKLHINTEIAKTGLRLVDGTQGDGKVLVSDASGNASWDFGQKAHLITLTAANTTDITIPKHPNTITIPGLEGFTAPATGKYIIYYHSFLQVDNNTGDKAFYFEVLQNGTKIKEPESYSYVGAGRIMAVNVPVIIEVNAGDQITFRWRDGLTFPAPAPTLTFRTGGVYMTRNFIEILYVGK